MVFKTEADAIAQASQEPKTCLRFKAAYVFDLSQTDGNPLPCLSSVAGDPQARVSALPSVVRPVERLSCGPACRLLRNSRYSPTSWPMRCSTTARPARPPRAPFASWKPRPLLSLSHGERWRNMEAFCQISPGLSLRPCSEIAAPSRLTAARAELYAVGLGPANPAAPSGTPFTGAAPTANPRAEISWKVFRHRPLPLHWSDALEAEWAQLSRGASENRPKLDAE
jgi:hypothetical protein